MSFIEIAEAAMVEWARPYKEEYRKRWAEREARRELEDHGIYYDNEDNDDENENYWEEKCDKFVMETFKDEDLIKANEHRDHLMSLLVFTFINLCKPV